MAWLGAGPGSTKVDRTKTITAPTMFVLTSRIVSSVCTRVRRWPACCSTGPSRTEPNPASLAVTRSS